MFLVPPPGLTSLKGRVTPPPSHIESVSNATSFLSGNLSLNLAGGPLAGDLIFITSAQGGGGSSDINQPSGFTDLTTLAGGLSGDGQFRLEVMYKIATGAEGTNFGLTRSATGVGWAAGVSVYRDNSVAAPVVNGQITSSPSGGSQNFPQVPASVDDSDLSCLFMIANRAGASAVNISSRPANYTTAIEQAFDDSGAASLGTTDRILMAYFAIGGSLAARPLTPNATFNNALEAHSVTVEVENL